MLEGHELSFSYEKTERLHRVKFSVAPGALLALFGHNGSGKSTLLKLLGGSLRVQQGSLSWNGQSALAANNYVRADLRRHCGILFQGSSSDEKLSVRDNLMFSARLYGIGRAAALKRVDEILQMSTLTARAHEKVKKLSLGTRRRLELYRCFLHAPKIVLLDEPTAGLDGAEITKFFSFLQRYREENRAVIIMASHHADELLYADKVLMMKDGRIVDEGTPSAMLAQLDYLRCSFQLEACAHHVVDSLKVYESEHHPDGSIHAKIKTRDLDHLLKHPALSEAPFKLFCIEKPSLSDRYRDVIASGATHE